MNTHTARHREDMMERHKERKKKCSERELKPRSATKLGSWLWSTSPFLKKKEGTALVLIDLVWAEGVEGVGK